MPKKTQNSANNDADRLPSEPAPTLLSEEGIAKLQAAVDAAQRKRLPRHNPPTDSKNGD